MTARIFRSEPCARRDRGLHGLRIGVHGEERHAGPATLSTPFATVFSMSCSFMSRKTRLPRADQPIDEREAARKRELIADLVERNAVAEPFDHRLGIAQAGRSSATIRRSRGFGIAFSGLFSVATPEGKARQSTVAVNPDAGRRHVAPDALGRLDLDAGELRDRRHHRIGELDEGRFAAQQSERLA